MLCLSDGIRTIPEGWAELAHCIRGLKALLGWRELAQALSSDLPVQFIFTTHSPVALDGLNTMLKRVNLPATDGQLPASLEQIVSLPAQAESAYHTSLESLEPLMDPEEELLQDHLIEPFNVVASTFDDVCHLKAGRALAINT